MNNPLLLPRPLVQQLFAHAQTAPEEEVCGLIARGEDGALKLRKIRNAAPDPARQFLMDEVQQVKAMQVMREQGEALFAIYHSHPGAPATPSAQDLEEVGYPDAWQLIISLNTKGVLELRAWRLESGTACETQLRIIED